MVGALESKRVLDKLSRKKSILFHTCFTYSASLLALLSFYSKIPLCLFISRFLFGLSGGMTSSIVPLYLNEISPINLRGQTGVLHQLMLTLGILVAQVLGFREILGTESLWHLYLSLPALFTLIGTLIIFLFFPESPKQLFMKYGKYEEAKRALQLLRSDLDVDDELENINRLSKLRNSTREMSIKELLINKELKWPLLTAICLHCTQQLSGVNVISYYSTSIFEKVNYIYISRKVLRKKNKKF